MKDFPESLKDGFEHITEISDQELLATLREKGIQIDTEGYYRKLFGDSKEYELRLEPVGEEGTYLVCLYKRGILLTEELAMQGVKK